MTPPLLAKATILSILNIITLKTNDVAHKALEPIDYFELDDSGANSRPYPLQ